MGKVTRTNGVDPYQDVFLRLTDRVNGAGLLRDAIDREIRRSGYSPREVKQHYEAIEESDQVTVDEILDRAHSLTEFCQFSPRSGQHDKPNEPNTQQESKT
ncbi:hypothetical protein [Halorussus salinus]|uniref:hypothetical protein n=1 Tax=Halorussus salinus TaxID=1364935 RepID=UPI0010930748|nr:hypothetical protein [Halorussus salinus]